MRTALNLGFACSVVCMLFLVGCATNPGIVELHQPLASTAEVGDLLNPSKLSRASKAALRGAGLRLSARRDPDRAIRAIDQRLQQADSPELRVAAAEVAINAAQRLREKDSGRALGYYLSAIEVTKPALGYRESAARDALKAVYNEETAELAAVFREAKGSGAASHVVVGPLREYRLRWKTSGPGIVNPGEVDTLRPASLFRVKGFEQRHTREGYGGALVGYQARTPERHRANPFMPKFGFAVSLTAVLRIPTAGEATVELHDVVDNAQFTHRGKSLPLVADFTAQIATLMDAAPPSKIGKIGMFRPKELEDKQGLFLLGPFRRDRIPLVLVHGLMSSPRTWREVIHACHSDPVLRATYQPVVFFYPTGFPIPRNAEKLRKALRSFEEHFDPRGRNPNMKRMVLIGHSMGGILSNAQIRSGGDDLWFKLSDKPMDEIEMTGEARQLAREMAYFEANPNIKRVIFICAPHRGSDIANKPIGRLGSKLVSYPLGLMDRTTETLLGAGTELTRTVFTKPTDSIDDLKVGAPVLDVILERPIVYNPPYHSIIGDRGRGDTPDSSDGVVRYWSSHLDGAASEKIVPSNHGATNHRETIEEVTRILYLHIGKRYRAAHP